MPIKTKLGIVGLVVCVFVVVTVVVWPSAKRYLLQDSCLDNGGKWAANGNYCIHRECAKDGSCKPSSQNNAVCSSLKIGLNQDELYFQLGMPQSNDGNVYTFTEGGGGSPIKATIMNGVLTELKCGT